ncbi:MAG: molecular chaperone TorD family protein [Gammaproteobacteria bacterium]
MDRVDLVAHSAASTKARNGIYQFLSVLFRHELSAEQIDQMCDPEFRDALSRAGVVLPDNFFIQTGQQHLTDLEVEYARLFVGPGRHISPHESVHRQDEQSGLYGHATVAVKQFIETAGFGFQSNYKGLPDHISVELEFMQTLTGWEAEAWEKDDTDLAMQCLELETRFVQEHLVCWVPAFCTKVAEEAELPFYREIAKLTSDFIVMEEEHLTTAKHRIPTEGIDNQSSGRGIH